MRVNLKVAGTERPFGKAAELLPAPAKAPESYAQGRKSGVDLKKIAITALVAIPTLMGATGLSALAQNNAVMVSMAPTSYVGAASAATSNIQVSSAQLTMVSTAATNNFSNWDAGNKGYLDATDVNREMANPNNHGAAAEAVATMKGEMDSSNGTLHITRSMLQYPAAPAPASSPSMLTSFMSALHLGSSPAPAPVPNNALFIDEAGHAIANLTAETPEHLNTGATPQLSDIRQSYNISDCYMLAAVGGNVYLHGTAAGSMVQPQAVAPNGQYTVNLPGAGAEKITLTDSQIAYYGGGHPGGIYQMVMEEASGANRNALNHNSATNDFQAISGGGTPAYAITLVTGHATKTIAIGANDSDATVMQVLGKIGIGKNLVIGSDRSGQDGTVKNHAYTILGVDASTNTVTVWNPFGYEAPNPNVKVLPGGIVEMPVSVFRQAIAEVTYEIPGQTEKVSQLPAAWTAIPANTSSTLGLPGR